MSQPIDKSPRASCQPDAPAFIDATRRGLLQGAAVAAGATVAGGAAIAAEPEVQAPDPAPTGSRGYHVTDHIREYYAKARF